RTSDLEIVESAGTATALALNDWGVVYVSPGKHPVEMAWSAINSVEETGIGVLAFRSSKSKFEIDCSLGRYMLITETIYNKIPERTNFDIDPSTCKSRILAKLESTPRERRFPRSEPLQHCGIRFPSFCSENRKICR